MNNYFMETHHHEWILTNRLGGYALGTGNLINQRKYHGLLIASDKCFQRKHLVSGMEEKVEWRGEVIHLDSNNYSNCIYPEGFLYLVKPWLRPYPIFLYSALPHQNSIMIRKEIMMDEDSNTTLVRYTNLGHHRLHFELHPKFSMTLHHDLNNPGSLDYEGFETKEENLELQSSFYIKRHSNQFEIYGALLGGEVVSNRYVFYNVFYPWEVMNGYPGIGDQISLFELRFDLKVGDSASILFSDSPLPHPDRMIDKIEKRYVDLPKPMDYPTLPDEDDTLLSKIDFLDSILFKRDDYMNILEFSLKDFLANDDVVAGYPFYGVWGRDTMFVLNALLHSKNNIDQIERILRKYSRYIQNGLIPNMLPETGREANYDTVDATLWYVILLYKLGKRKQKAIYWKEVIHLTEEILSGIINNYKYPFCIREDGLIELKEEFAHATWMDVRVDGKPITPRSGAPVEVNGLWYNAICCYEAMCTAYNEISEDHYAFESNIVSLKDKIYKAFQKFWMEDFLADRLVGDDQIAEIRPNALLALSLPFDLLSVDKLKLVFERAFKELYTFYGIRSLSPRDIRFRKKYYGNQRERDHAYHNGSVWAWLFGAFCGIYLKINRGVKKDKELADELSIFIGTFRNSFMRGHIASIAEIWDGDCPHFPKGAPAQAWSVAALYNIESFISSIEEEKK
ncbi:MAG: amylo-alpha-1,6-glucosidase [Candidatus Cloacimonetes bacterium]|nr:amylo-alpha-1,6-glucosidase [Candidatus Cloacimonadota bacterium]